MIIDGTAIAEEIQQEIKETIERLSGRPPCLAVISVGEHPPSKIYITRKMKACSLVGIRSIREELHASISQEGLLEAIQKFNNDPGVDGILVQLPLPPHISANKVSCWIDPYKDVDGLHPMNVGKMLIGDSDGFFPCTPLGIKVLIDRCHIDLKGKHVVVVGRSNIVGKPMAAMLLQSTPGFNATVSIVHRQSTQLKELCQMADILVVAVGQPHLIQADMVKKGVAIIDVGINKVEDDRGKSTYRIVGDVDFNNVKDKCSYITPVPGGVGPMTIAMLLSNTLKGYLKKYEI